MTTNDTWALIAVTVTGGAIVVSLISYLNLRLRMRTRPALPTSQVSELAARLERIEQALDAMALETERISEGQRFTTKLLSDRAPARSVE